MKKKTEAEPKKQSKRPSKTVTRELRCSMCGLRREYTIAIDEPWGVLYWTHPVLECHERLADEREAKLEDRFAELKQQLDDLSAQIQR